MKNAVLMSIRPTWANLIDRGDKTIEVRKSFPEPFKLMTPFKVYLYCTEGHGELLTIIRDGDDCYGSTYHGPPIFVTHPEGGYGMRLRRKTVFAEFVCDCAETLNELFVDDGPVSSVYHLPYNGNACLTVDDLDKYGNGKRLWGWHISNYKWYRDAKTLADFGLKHPPQSWCYVNELTTCGDCRWFGADSIVLPTGEKVGQCKKHDVTEYYDTWHCPDAEKKEVQEWAT